MRKDAHVGQSELHLSAPWVTHIFSMGHQTRGVKIRPSTHRISISIFSIIIIVISIIIVIIINNNITPVASLAQAILAQVPISCSNTLHPYRERFGL